MRVVKRVILQYGNKEINESDIISKVNDELKNKGVSAKKLDIYVKPEENSAYYVVDGVGSADMKINL